MITNDVAVIPEPSWVVAIENWVSPSTETFALKVALIHDWLPGMRSVEKVSCDRFPDASLWTLAEMLTFHRLLRNLDPAPACGDGGHGVMPRLVAAAGACA